MKFKNPLKKRSDSFIITNPEDAHYKLIIQVVTEDWMKGKLPASAPSDVYLDGGVPHLSNVCENRSLYVGCVLNSRLDDTCPATRSCGINAFNFAYKNWIGFKVISPIEEK